METLYCANTRSPWFCPLSKWILETDFFQSWSRGGKLNGESSSPPTHPDIKQQVGLVTVVTKTDHYRYRQSLKYPSVAHFLSFW